MRVDAHQHYWDPRRGDYGWMPENDPVLSRPYGPADLARQLARANVVRSVVVQAAPSVHETEYMLGIADSTETVAGIVGWIDFENRHDLKHLERLRQHPKFLGVRPMVQDIADVDWMLRDDIQWAFQALIDLDLSFDALGFPKHLSNFHAILTRYPELRTVIDHGMKPRIRDRAFDDWAAGMTRLADDTDACCKLSGLVTEADEDWTPDDLRPYVDHILSAFGPKRVMWGSDWPVVRLRCEYERWHRVAEALTAHLGDADRAEIFGGTAIRFYRLPV